MEGKHGKLERLADVDLTPAFSVSMIVECGDRQEVFDIPNKQTVGKALCYMFRLGYRRT